MDLIVTATGTLSCAGQTYRCALGRGGVAAQKQEGDGVTPAGVYPLRRLYYRADRLAVPATGLDAQPLAPDDGWCDAPGDTNYNRFVRHPYPASAEHLWRDDGLYDVIVVIGYNDDPPRDGLGSAIFLHAARPDYGPTEGCVALKRDDLLTVVAKCDGNTRIRIGQEAG